MHVFPPVILFPFTTRPSAAATPEVYEVHSERCGPLWRAGRWALPLVPATPRVRALFRGEIRGNTHIERDHTPRLPLFHYSLSVSPSYPALSYPALSKATRANPHGSLPPSTPCSIPFSLSSAATSPACGACSPREHTSMCLIANWGPAYGEARGGPASAAGRRRRGAVARPPQCRTGGSPPRWVRHGGRAGG